MQNQISSFNTLINCIFNRDIILNQKEIEKLQKFINSDDTCIYLYQRADKTKLFISSEEPDSSHLFVYKINSENQQLLGFEKKIEQFIDYSFDKKEDYDSAIQIFKEITTFESLYQIISDKQLIKGITYFLQEEGCSIENLPIDLLVEAINHQSQFLKANLNTFQQMQSNNQNKNNYFEVLTILKENINKFLKDQISGHFFFIKELFLASLEIILYNFDQYQSDTIQKIQNNLKNQNIKSEFIDPILQISTQIQKTCEIIKQKKKQQKSYNIENGKIIPGTQKLIELVKKGDFYWNSNFTNFQKIQKVQKAFNSIHIFRGPLEQLVSDFWNHFFDNFENYIRNSSFFTLFKGYISDKDNFSKFLQFGKTEIFSQLSYLLQFDSSLNNITDQIKKYSVERIKILQISAEQILIKQFNRQSFIVDVSTLESIQTEIKELAKSFGKLDVNQQKEYKQIKNKTSFLIKTFMDSFKNEITLVQQMENKNVLILDETKNKFIINIPKELWSYQKDYNLLLEVLKDKEENLTKILPSQKQVLQIISQKKINFERLEYYSNFYNDLENNINKMRINLIVSDIQNLEQILKSLCNGFTSKKLIECEEIILNIKKKLEHFDTIEGQLFQLLKESVNQTGRQNNFIFFKQVEKLFKDKQPENEYEKKKIDFVEDENADAETLIENIQTFGRRKRDLENYQYQMVFEKYLKVSFERIKTTMLNNCESIIRNFENKLKIECEQSYQKCYVVINIFESSEQKYSSLEKIKVIFEKYKIVKEQKEKMNREFQVVLQTFNLFSIQPRFYDFCNKINVLIKLWESLESKVANNQQELLKLEKDFKDKFQKQSIELNSKCEALSEVIQALNQKINSNLNLNEKIEYHQSISEIKQNQLNGSIIVLESKIIDYSIQINYYRELKSLKESWILLEKMLFSVQADMTLFKITTPLKSLLEQYQVLQNFFNSKKFFKLLIFADFCINFSQIANKKWLTVSERDSNVIIQMIEDVEIKINKIANRIDENQKAQFIVQSVVDKTFEDQLATFSFPSHIDIQITDKEWMIDNLSDELKVLKNFFEFLKTIISEKYISEYLVELHEILRFPLPLENITIFILLNYRIFIMKKNTVIKGFNKRFKEQEAAMNTLRELENWKEVAVFNFMRFRIVEELEVPIITGWDELLNSTQENSLKLYMLSNTRIAIKQAEILKLLKKYIGSLDECLNRLKFAQVLMIQLEPSCNRKTFESTYSDTVKKFSQLSFVLESKKKISCLLDFPHIVEYIENLIINFEIAHKKVASYLETKRKIFPRLYFIGDNDFLEMMGQLNEQMLQFYIRKIYPGISKTYQLNEAAIVKVGDEREELVLQKQVVFAGVEIEIWMANLASEIKRALISQILIPRDEKPSVCLEILLMESGNLCPQSIYIICMVILEKCLYSVRPSEVITLLQNFQNEVVKTQILSPVSKHHKLKLLILFISSALRYIEELNLYPTKQSWTDFKTIKFSISEEEKFVELKKPNLTLKQHQMIETTNEINIIARIAGTSFHYGYEFYGSKSHLMMTEVTDRCFVSMALSVRGLKSSCFVGPAGTGKTETVKYFGQLLGKLVIVFNCDETLDFDFLQRIFDGLNGCSAFGCFDEFNRLSKGQLSVFGQFLSEIPSKIKGNQNEKQEKIKVSEIYSEQKKQWSIFLTMNPKSEQYGGRNELPQSIKRIFRTVYVKSAENSKILELLLFCESFVRYKILAAALYKFLTQAQEKFSNQRYYDWSLRKLKAIVRLSGEMRQKIVEQNTDFDEEQLIIESIINTLMGELETNDIQILDQILSDCFKNYQLYIKNKSEKTVQKSYLLSNLKFGPLNELGISYDDLDEAVSLFKIMINQRNGVILYGDSGSFKSIIWKIALGQDSNVRLVSINPKSFSREFYIGSYNNSTREFKEGIFSKLAKSINGVKNSKLCLEQIESEGFRKMFILGGYLNDLEGINIFSTLKIKHTIKNKIFQSNDETIWVLFDCEIEPEWAEALNSVLDDNRLLTLPNGERILFGQKVKFIFETRSLNFASPAIISRLGLLDMNKFSKKCLQCLNNNLIELEKTSVSPNQQKTEIDEMEYGNENLGNDSLFLLNLILVNIFKKESDSQDKYLSTIRSQIFFNNSILLGQNTIGIFLALASVCPKNTASIQTLLQSFVVPEYLQDLNSSRIQLLQRCFNILSESQTPLLISSDFPCFHIIEDLIKIVGETKKLAVIQIFLTKNSNRSEIIKRIERVGTKGENGGSKRLEFMDMNPILIVHNMHSIKKDEYQDSDIFNMLHNLVFYGQYTDEKGEMIVLDQGLLLIGISECALGKLLIEIPKKITQKSVIFNLPNENFEDFQKFAANWSDNIIKTGKNNVITSLNDTINLLTQVFQILEPFDDQFGNKFVGYKGFCQVLNSLYFYQKTIKTDDEEFKQILFNLIEIQFLTKFTTEIRQKLEIKLFDIFQIQNKAFFSYLNSENAADNIQKKDTAQSEQKNRTNQPQIKYDQDGISELHQYSKNQMISIIIENLSKLNPQIKVTAELLKAVNALEMSSVLLSQFNKVIIGNSIGKKQVFIAYALLNNLNIIRLPNVKKLTPLIFSATIFPAISNAVYKGQMSILLIDEWQLLFGSEGLLDAFINYIRDGDLIGIDEEELNSLKIVLLEKNKGRKVKFVEKNQSVNKSNIFKELLLAVKGLFSICLILEEKEKIKLGMLSEYPELKNHFYIYRMSEGQHSEFLKENFENLITKIITENKDKNNHMDDGEMNKMIEKPLAQLIMSFFENFNLFSQKKFHTFQRNIESIYNKELSNYDKEIEKLQKGLKSLIDGEKKVMDLKQEVEINREIIAKKTNESYEALELIEKVYERANQNKLALKQLEENLKICNQKISKKKMEIESELAELSPVLERSKKDIQGISKSNLDELRMLKKPPDLIIVLFHALSILLDVECIEWKDVKKLLSQSRMIEDLIKINPKTISHQQVTDIKRLVEQTPSAFDPKGMYRLSQAAGPIAGYLQAILEFREKYKMIEPIELHQAELEANLVESQKEFQENNKRIALADEEVKELMSQYTKKTVDAEKLQKEFNQLENSLIKGTELLRGLEDEKERWRDKVSKITNEKLKLGRNTVLVAFKITFGNNDFDWWTEYQPYDIQQLQSCKCELCEQCVKNIFQKSYKRFQNNEHGKDSRGQGLFEEETDYDGSYQKIFENLEEVLGKMNFFRFFDIEKEILRCSFASVNPAEDIRLLDNILVSILSEETPFILDPTQNFSNFMSVFLNQNFIKADISDPLLIEKLSLSMKLGKQILIQNVGSKFPQFLFPVIKHFYWRLNNEEKEFDLNFNSITISGDFKMYLTSSLNSFENLCEEIKFLSREIAFINNTNTVHSLSEAITDIMFESEDPETYIKQSQTRVIETKSFSELTSLENEILNSLSESSSELLQNEKLLKTLLAAQQKSKDLKLLLRETFEERIKLVKERQLYNKSATIISEIYIALQTMTQINSYYVLSYKRFMQIVRRTMERSKILNNIFNIDIRKSGSAVDERQKSDDKSFQNAFIQILLEEIYNSYFTEDISFLILILIAKLKFSERDFKALQIEDIFLQKGGKLKDQKLLLARFYQFWPDCEVGCIKTQDFSKELLVDPNPEVYLELKTDQQLSLLQRLIIIKIFRPERLNIYIQQIMEKEYGVKIQELNQSVIKYAEMLQENPRPILFCMKEGSDSTYFIEGIFNKLKIESNKCIQISCGGYNSEEIWNKILNRTKPMVIKNAHLNPDLLEKLITQNTYLNQERKVELKQKEQKQKDNKFSLKKPKTQIKENQEIQEEFIYPYLMISTEECQSLIQMQSNQSNDLILIAYGNNDNLIKSMEKLYTLLPNGFLSSFKNADSWVIFSLSRLHCAIMERDKLRPIGWKSNYGFGLSDFLNAIELLQDLYPKKDWLDLFIEVVIELVYGCKIDDKEDLLILKKLQMNILIKKQRTDYESIKAVYYPDSNNYEQHLECIKTLQDFTKADLLIENSDPQDIYEYEVSELFKRIKLITNDNKENYLQNQLFIYFKILQIFSFNFNINFNQLF